MFRLPSHSDKKSQKGFTLVELMIAITIVAILATIGLTVFSNIQRSARDAKRRADVEAISKAYEVRYNSYLGEHCGGTAAGTYCPWQNNWMSGGQMPTDPSNNAAYSGTNPWPVTSFRICSQPLESGPTQGQQFCRDSQRN